MTDVEKVEYIRAAIAKNPKLRDGWKILARRERGRGILTFRTFDRNLKQEDKIWTKEEITNFFVLAEKAELGKIVLGKDTKVFYWSVHLQEIADAIISGKKPPGHARPVTPPKNTIRKPFEEEAPKRKVETYVRPQLGAAASGPDSDDALVDAAMELISTLDEAKLSPKGMLALIKLTREIRKRS